MDYQKELFAQCTPYLQWLEEREPIKDREKEATGEPICVFPFSSCTDSIKTVFGESSVDRERIYLFINADGVLHEGAQTLITRAFDMHKKALVIYLDEDYYETLEGNRLFRSAPWFKPDFSPDTLESFFYIGNIFALKGQAIVAAIEAFGSDMSLCAFVRSLARQTVALQDNTHGGEVFVHIPEVLYTNNRLSKKDELDCFEEVADVVRIGGKRQNLGRLSVIIPSKDNPQTLKRCVETFCQCAKDVDYELIIVDNGSTNDNRKCITTFLEQCGAKYLYEKAEFNFSKMCNLGAKAADGDFLLFLNDDITVSDASKDGLWLHKMMRYAAMAHVGAVGLKLHYPDGNLLQHAGITNMAIGPAHKLCGMADEGNLYHGHNLADYDMLAVTAACMMIARETFLRVGGFDETFAVAYNDVELCFRLYQTGLYNVQVNSAFLTHHESLSRGEDTVPEKQARLLCEKQKLYKKHPWASPGTQTADPFYSPNLVQWEKDAAYHVNYQYPYDKIVEIEPFRVKYRRFKGAASNFFHRLTGEAYHMFHIDQVTQEEGIVTIVGWHVLRKKDNAKLLKKFWICGPHRQAYEVALSPKLRRDVEALFVGEGRTKNTALSGIFLKIDISSLTKGTYTVGIVVKRRWRGRLLLPAMCHFEV